MFFSYGQKTNCGSGAIFHIEIQRKAEALHRMAEMYMHIRLRLLFLLFTCLFDLAVLAR